MPAHNLTPDVPPEDSHEQRWSLKCDKDCESTDVGDPYELQDKGWCWNYQYNTETGEVINSSALCPFCNPRHTPENCVESVRPENHPAQTKLNEVLPV